MTDDERRYVAFHEAGHVAMVYWLAESLHARHVVLHQDRFGGSLYRPALYPTVCELMVLIGGPMAELLSLGVTPKKAIRFLSEYRIPSSDTSRIRNIVRNLRGGKDDKVYQFEIQERVRAILQVEAMWQGITAVAEKLLARGRMTGEECEELLMRSGAPNWLSSCRSEVSFMLAG